MFPTDSFELDRTLHLQTSDAPITLQLKEVELSRLDTELPDCKLTFTLPVPDYLELEGQEHLGLNPSISQHAFLNDLDPQQPIEIEATLQRELVPLLLSEAEELEEYQESPARGVAIYLQDLDRNYAYALTTDANNWYAIAVKQAISLPEALDDGESVAKIGVTTEWGKQFAAEAEEFDAKTKEQKTEDLNTKGGIYAVMEAFFQKQGLDYQALPEDGAILLTIPGESGRWNCYCEALEEQQYCRIYSIFPEVIPPEQKAAMIAFLMQANARLTIGNFEMRDELGEVRFRTAIDVQGDRFSVALMKQLFVGNIVAMEQHFGAIRLVLNGVATPDDALLLCSRTGDGSLVTGD